MELRELNNVRAKRHKLLALSTAADNFPADTQYTKRTFRRGRGTRLACVTMSYVTGLSERGRAEVSKKLIYNTGCLEVFVPIPHIIISL